LVARSVTGMGVKSVNRGLIPIGTRRYGGQVLGTDTAHTSSHIWAQYWRVLWYAALYTRADVEHTKSIDQGRGEMSP